jgi:hypothetical protein
MIFEEYKYQSRKSPLHVSIWVGELVDWLALLSVLHSEDISVISNVNIRKLYRIPGYN